MTIYVYMYMYFQVLPDRSIMFKFRLLAKLLPIIDPGDTVWSTENVYLGDVNMGSLSFVSFKQIKKKCLI